MFAMSRSSNATPPDLDPVRTGMINLTPLWRSVPQFLPVQSSPQLVLMVMFISGSEKRWEAAIFVIKINRGFPNHSESVMNFRDAASW